MQRRIDRRTLMAISAASAVAINPGTSFAQDSTPDSDAAGSAIPDTAVGQQLAWIIGVINDEVPMPGEAEIEERFAPVFLAEVPAETLIPTLGQLQASFAPLVVEEVLNAPTDYLLNVRATASDGSSLVVMISVEETGDHLINGLFFGPYSDPAADEPVMTEWSELDAALQTDTGTFGISASKVVAGELNPVHQVNPDDAFAIGSAFKLYVLAAVADAIEAGDLTWEAEIELVEKHLSLPSGVTQTEPLGTMLDVTTLATRMISISDNTATDLLMQAVGRDRVEATLETLGNSVPERNRPFLTTREMFLIKLGNADRRAEFATADETTRRAILAEIETEALPPLEEVMAWEKPLEIDLIEWFASMTDLERAHLWLREAWARPGLEPLREVLTTNPGVPYDTEQWPTVAFKGGSEPGVMALAWLLENAAGDVFTFSLAVNNPAALLAETQIALAAAGAFALLD